MSQSLVKNYVHIVFSTKYRQSFIQPPFDSELYSYVGGTARELDCNPVIVGGYRDHIHVLCVLSKKIALMNLVEKIKSHSSKWFKTKDKSLQNFYWQNGYGAFSVDYRSVDIVENYIATQEEHHTRKSFEEEYLEYLKEYQIEYDERYIWD